MKVQLFVLASILTVGQCQFLNCGWVNNLNCVSYPGTVECGTDGNDYGNRCYFAKATCLDKNLHIYADGTCASKNYYPAGKTTMQPTQRPIVTGGMTKPVVTTPAYTGPTTTRAPIFLGHNALLDFFCLELSHEQCPTDTEKVCASDAKTYANFCEYEKQRCSHRTLSVNHFGQC